MIGTADGDRDIQPTADHLVEAPSFALDTATKGSRFLRVTRAKDVKIGHCIQTVVEGYEVAAFNCLVLTNKAGAYLYKVLQMYRYTRSNNSNHKFLSLFLHHKGIAVLG